MHPFYRSRQALLSVVLHLAEKRKQPFWLEENALMQLAPELAQRDLRFILLVTTAGMVRRGTLAPFFASLQSHGIAFSVFSDDAAILSELPQAARLRHITIANIKAPYFFHFFITLSSSHYF